MPHNKCKIHPVKPKKLLFLIACTSLAVFFFPKFYFMLNDMGTYYVKDYDCQCLGFKTGEINFADGAGLCFGIPYTCMVSPTGTYHTVPQITPTPTPETICPNAMTTIAIDDCLVDLLKNQDAMLTQVIAQLKSSPVIATDPDEIKTLTDSQSTFLKYRENQCYLESIVFKNGTARNSAYIDCAIHLTKDRIQSLSPLYDQIKDRPTEISTASPTPTPSTTPFPEITKLSASVLSALKSRDFANLAKYVHPTKGLRLSPYSYINSQYLVFSSSQLPNLPVDKTIYTWGTYDGSGFSIQLTFADYHKKFIFDRDYTLAPQVKYNQLIKTGNTMSNISEFYPNAQFVEYHFPDTKAQEFMDWSSLRLIFEKYQDKYYLVGIVHDYWTI